MSQQKHAEDIIQFLKTIETELSPGLICVRRCAQCYAKFEYVGGPDSYEYIRNHPAYNQKGHAPNCSWQKAMNAAQILMKEFK